MKLELQVDSDKIKAKEIKQGGNTHRRLFKVMEMDGVSKSTELEKVRQRRTLMCFLSHSRWS